MRIIGLAGWSGSGKTTLVSRVIPIFVKRGLKVSTVKHAHKGFDIDIPGKDSHTHRMVGATEVFVASGRRWAQIHELRGEPEPELADIVPKLAPVDLLIVEGFKRHRHPKIEIYRAEVGKPLLHPEDDYIVAIASDGPIADARIPVIPLDDLEKIADVMSVEAMPVERLKPMRDSA
jgi:molybdopterin-guanine dinucleotide biosynthesis protein B